MSHEESLWDAGRITREGEYPRLVGSLRGDSARMVRAYKAITKLSITNVFGRAIEKLRLAYTLESGGTPLMLSHREGLETILASRELPEATDADRDMIEPVDVNITEANARFLENLVVMEGLEVSDAVNRAIHIQARMGALAFEGAQMVSEIPEDLQDWNFDI